MAGSAQEPGSGMVVQVSDTYPSTVHMSATTRTKAVSLAPLQVHGTSKGEMSPHATLANSNATLTASGAPTEGVTSSPAETSVLSSPPLGPAGHLLVTTPVEVSMTVAAATDKGGANDKSSGSESRQQQVSTDHKRHASWAPEHLAVEGVPRPPSRTHMGSRTMSRKLQSQGRHVDRSLSNQHSSMRSSKGRHHHTVMEVDMLDGSKMTINRAWLLEWLEELRHLPEGLHTDAMDQVLSSTSGEIQAEQIQTLLLCLPSREVLRFKQMADTTMRVAAATASALNQDYVEFAVEHTFHRIQAQLEGRWIATPPSEKRSRTSTPPQASDTPANFIFLLDQFDKQVEAAKKIQRAFRAFKTRCDRSGCWPSGGAAEQEQESAPSTRSRYMDVYRHGKQHKGKQELKKMFTTKLLDRMRSRASQAGSSRSVSPMPVMSDEQMQAVAEVQAEKLASQAIRDRKIAQHLARRQAKAQAKEQEREERREARRAAKQQAKELVLRTRIAHAQLRKVASLRDQVEDAIQEALQKAARALEQNAEEVAKAMGVTVGTAQDVIAASADAAALAAAGASGAGTAEAAGVVASASEGQQAGRDETAGKSEQQCLANAQAGDPSKQRAAQPAEQSEQQTASLEAEVEPLSALLMTSTGMDPAFAATVTALTAQTSSAAVLLSEPAVAGLNVRKIDNVRSSLAGSIAAQPSLAALLVTESSGAASTGPLSPSRLGNGSGLTAADGIGPLTPIGDLWAEVTEEALAAMGTVSAGILLDRLEKAAKEDLAALKPKRGRSRHLADSARGSIASFAAPRVASLTGAASVKSSATAAPSSPTCPASPAAKHTACPASPAAKSSPGGQVYPSSPHRRSSSAAGFAVSPSHKFRQSIASFGPASPGANRAAASSRFAGTCLSPGAADSGGFSLNGAGIRPGSTADAAGTATTNVAQYRSSSPARSTSPTRSISPTRALSTTPTTMLESAEERLARWEALVQQKELFADYMSSSEDEDSDSTMSSDASSSSSSSSMSTINSSDSEPETDHTDHTSHTGATNEDGHGEEDKEHAWQQQPVVTLHLPHLESTIAGSSHIKKVQILASLTQEMDTMKKAVIVGQTMLENSQHFYNHPILRSETNTPKPHNHDEQATATAPLNLSTTQSLADDGMQALKSLGPLEHAAAGGIPHAEYLQSGSAMLHHMMFHEGLELIGDVARAQSREQLQSVLQAQVNKVVDKRLASARRRVGLKLPEPETDLDVAAQLKSQRSHRSSGNPLTARSRCSTQDSIKEGPLSVQGASFERMHLSSDAGDDQLQSVSSQQRRKTVDELNGSSKSMRALEAVSMGEDGAAEDGPALQPWGTGVRQDILTPPMEPTVLAANRPAQLDVSVGAVQGGAETTSPGAQSPLSPMLALRQQRRHADKGSTLGRASVSRCKLQRDPLSPNATYNSPVSPYQPSHDMRSPKRYLFDNSGPDVTRVRMTQLSEQMLSLQQQQLFLDNKLHAAAVLDNKSQAAHHAPAHLDNRAHDAAACEGVQQALLEDLVSAEHNSSVITFDHHTIDAGADPSDITQADAGARHSDTRQSNAGDASDDAGSVQHSEGEAPEAPEAVSTAATTAAGGAAATSEQNALPLEAAIAGAVAGAGAVTGAVDDDYMVIQLKASRGIPHDVTYARLDACDQASSPALRSGSENTAQHEGRTSTQQPASAEPCAAAVEDMLGQDEEICGLNHQAAPTCKPGMTDQVQEDMGELRTLAQPLTKPVQPLAHVQQTVQGQEQGEGQGQGQGQGPEEYLMPERERQELGQTAQRLQDPALDAQLQGASQPAQPGLSVGLHRASGNNPEVTHQLFLAKARRYMERREEGLPVTYAVRAINSMSEAAGYLAAPHLAQALMAASLWSHSVGFHGNSLSPMGRSSSPCIGWPVVPSPSLPRMPFSSLRPEDSNSEGSEGSSSRLPGPEPSFKPSPSLGPMASQGSDQSSGRYSLAQHASSSTDRSASHMLSPHTSTAHNVAARPSGSLHTAVEGSAVGASRSIGGHLDQDVNAAEVANALHGLRTIPPAPSCDAHMPTNGRTVTATEASLQLDLMPPVHTKDDSRQGPPSAVKVVGAEHRHQKRHRRKHRNHGSVAADGTAGTTPGLKLPKIAGNRSPRDSAAASAYMQSWLAATAPATQATDEPARRAAPVVNVTLPLLAGSPDLRLGAQHAVCGRQPGEATVRGMPAGAIEGLSAAGMIPARMLPYLPARSEQDLKMSATVVAHWDSMMQAIIQPLASKPMPGWLATPPASGHPGQ